MYAYPLYPARKTVSLDGIWDFAFLGEDLPALQELDINGIVFDEIAAVPGCFDAGPKYAGKLCKAVLIYREKSASVSSVPARQAGRGGTRLRGS